MRFIVGGKATKVTSRQTSPSSTFSGISSRRGATSAASSGWRCEIV
jgi:hypothetical protein